MRPTGSPCGQVGDDREPQRARRLRPYLHSVEQVGEGALVRPQVFHLYMTIFDGRNPASVGRDALVPPTNIAERYIAPSSRAKSRQGRERTASRRWQVGDGREPLRAKRRRLHLLLIEQVGADALVRPPNRETVFILPSPLGEGGTSASEANRVTNEGSGYDKRNIKDNPSSPPTAELPPEGKPYKVWAFLVHPVGGARANRPTVGYADKYGRK